MKVPCKANEENGCPICKIVGKPNKVLVPAQNKVTGENIMVSMDVDRYEELKESHKIFKQTDKIISFKKEPTDESLHSNN